MLSVFNNPSQSGLWIVWWKVSQEGIYMYHFDFFFHANRHGHKEKNWKSFDVKYDNSQGMQKNDQEMGRAKYLKYFIIGFYVFYDYQYWKIYWH